MSVREAVQHLLASRDELDAGSAQQEALQQGVELLSDCRLRRRVRLAGVLKSVTYPASGNRNELVAELYDGSGNVDLIWLGRADMTGIEPGRKLIVEGTLCPGGSNRGPVVMYNPAYRLRPADQS